MLIRNFIPGEEIELRHVFMSSVHNLACDFYTSEQLNAWAPVSYDKERWSAMIATLRPFVAVIEGIVVGYADLQDSGYIDHFFVSGDFSSRGIGGALMQHINEDAARRGLSELSAHVSRSAEAFFIKHGFLVDERRTVFYGDIPMENARMSKRLLANKSMQPTPYRGG